MKKRLKRKLANKKERIKNACYECGHQMTKNNVYTYHHKYLGDLTVFGEYKECNHCKKRFYGLDMIDICRKAEKERKKELLLKNYPPESNEYISEDEMCKLENCTKEELKNKYINDLVYNLEINGNHLYLKKSYELYKEKNRPGWFDITYHHK